ncbi:WYL domain-containing protein [bacterium]|nr:WYL domain-containing protein [bacterium]
MFTSTKPPLRRFLVIDRELRAKTYPTAERLAELTETNAKTIRRDIQFLQDEYHAPIEFHHAKHGWEYTCPTYRLPAVLITEGELVSVFLAAQVLPQVQGTPYAADLERAIRKITELLPDEISVHWETIEQAHSFRQSVTTLHDFDLFRQLADAVLHRQQLRIRYWTASREEECERVIDPWHLACIDGAWYVIAWCHRRQARRMFAPSRIRELTGTGETFVVPEDFRIAEFFDGTFRVVTDSSQPLQRVRLRFAPSAAKYIREKVWHLSQKLQTAADGSVIVEFHLRNLLEIRRFVMSWGSECTVLDPAELRADIHREAQAMLEQSTEITLPELLPSKTTRTPKSRKETA